MKQTYMAVAKKNPDWMQSKADVYSFYMIQLMNQSAGEILLSTVYYGFHQKQQQIQYWTVI